MEKVKYCVCFALFVLAFWGVNYTADWIGYESFFEEHAESRDLGFEMMVQYFRSHGLEYKDLFRLHILIMAFCYTLFFKHIHSSPLVLLLFVFLYYAAMGNQIRFYTSLPIAYLSYYQLIIRRDRKLYITFATISIVGHFTLVLYHGCILLFIFLNKHCKHLLLAIVLINLFLLGLTNSGIVFQGQYESYGTAEGISSLYGGLYHVLIPIIAIMMVVFTYKLTKNLKCHNEPELILFFVMSVGTSMLLLPGIYIQILNHRFVSSCLPIWLAYFTRVSGYCKYSNKVVLWSFMFLLVILSLMKIFVFPYWFGLPTATMLEMKLMIDSYKL